MKASTCYDPLCELHNPNMNVKTLFPRASQSFIKANPLSLTDDNEKTPSRPSVGAGKGIREKMTKPEAEFALILEARKQAGEILRWEFQGITLRWFDMRYTPDFVVFGTENRGWGKTLTLIEVKGPHIHYRQQALARFKGARGFWPEFTFEMWQLQKCGVRRWGWKQIL